MKKRWLLYGIIISTIVYWLISFWEMSQNNVLLPCGYIINTSNEVLLIFMWIHKTADRKIIGLLFFTNFIGEFLGSTLFYMFIYWVALLIP
jgi:hypothetical protein